MSPTPARLGPVEDETQFMSFEDAWAASLIEGRKVTMRRRITVYPFERSRWTWRVPAVLRCCMAGTRLSNMWLDTSLRQASPETYNITLLSPDQIPPEAGGTEEAHAGASSTPSAPARTTGEWDL